MMLPEMNTFSLVSRLDCWMIKLVWAVSCKNTPVSSQIISNQRCYQNQFYAEVLVTFLPSDKASHADKAKVQDQEGIQNSGAAQLELFFTWEMTMTM